MKLKDILKKDQLTEITDIRDLKGGELTGNRGYGQHQTGLSDSELRDLNKIVKKFQKSVNSPSRRPKLSNDELVEVFGKMVLYYIESRF